MASEREDLARDIWRSGVTDPDLLAEWLIREGWGRRRDSFTAGVLSTVEAVNAIEPPIMKQITRGIAR